MIRHSDDLLTGLLVLLLLAAPLPFGGVTPWAEALLRGICFFALALAAPALESPAAVRPAAIPAAALAGVALLGLLQAAPMPAGLVAAVSPEHASLERQAASLTAPANAPGGPARLTLAAAASRSAAVGWAAAAAIFLAAAVVGRRRVHRRWLGAALLAVGLFEVFFGARDWIARASTLWGVEVPVAIRLRGTFVNPNHLAVYLEMVLPVAFAWGWWAARRAREKPQLERRLLLVAPPVMLWLTLFAGLAFSGSRGGLLAAVAAVTAQGFLAARVRKRWWLAPLGALAALAGVAVVASVGLREGLGRLLTTSATDVSLGARLREYGAGFELWRRFPLTGSGLGTFRDAFPLVQTPDLQGTFWHPHSDLLEVLSTTGLIGAALVLAGLVALLRRLAKVLAAGYRSEDRAAALAALGILVSLGLHECFEFGLTMPGNAVTLAVLLGSVTTARVARIRSAQRDRAGEDLAAAQAFELQDVEPAPQRRRHAQGPSTAHGRLDQEGAHGGAVEP
jgi:O-antigen ligase/polysaccharide polymerase Wzy-like membrane protein